MSKTLKALLIILAFVLGGGGAYLYFQIYGSKHQIISPPVTSITTPKTIPKTTPEKETSTQETTTAPSATTSKTVKDVHCLQNPTKGDQITIENLTDYQTIQSPLTFSGRANAFENQFNFRLKDCRGPIIAEGTVTAEGEMGTMPPYSKTITFTLSRAPMDAILEVYELSAANGDEVHLFQVPLRLTR